MKTNLRILPALIFIAILVLLVVFPGRKWARAHVNYKTAVEDHPLNCLSCHLYTQKTGVLAKLINRKYLSPFNLTTSTDGKSLYVVAQEDNSLLVVDTDKKKVTDKIKVGTQPHSVIISKDGKTAYVTNEWSDNVSVIDLNTLKVTDTLNTANGPAGLSLSADGKYLYVVDSYSSNISVFDLQSREEIRRFDTGNNPTGTGLSPDGKNLIVTSRRVLIKPYGDTLKSEVTIVDAINNRVRQRLDVKDAYMMENVAFTPDGSLAFLTMIRPKNYVPSIQVENGWMMTYGFVVIEMKENGRVAQFLVDEPNAYYSDPFDIVITPDGKKAFTSHSGVNTVCVIDIDSIRAILDNSTPAQLAAYSNNLGTSSKYVVKRITTGANPKGLSLSPDGKELFIAEQLQDRIMAVNTESLNTDYTIDLGGPKKITVARQGRRLFNNSGHTFQNQFDCYTCHPDMHEDGLVYNMASKDMGRNLTNTQSLRDIGDTPPYKWNGKNQTVYKQDGMRFSTVLTRTEAFNYNDLDALTAYIITGIPYPPNLQYNPHGVLTDAQKRGKKLFERTKTITGAEIPEKDRCITCHTPPYYTNLKMAYVQTLAASDDSMLFDTPHLNNIYASAPYLHDGRAATLEEIWTKYGKTEKHGIVNDMTKEQLNDLIEYLKSLRAPNYEYEDMKNSKSEK